MQEVRCNGAACVLNKKIYMTGGTEEEDGLSSVERYDPAKNQWETVAPMNVERTQHNCCAMNGAIFVVGGCDGYMNWYTSVEKYDEQIDKWTIVRPYF